MVVEDFGGQLRALLGLALQGNAGLLHAGVAAQRVHGGAHAVADGGAVGLRQLQVPLRHLGFAVGLDLLQATLGQQDKTIGRLELVARLVGGHHLVVKRIGLGNRLVGREDEQGLAVALVQRVLRAAHGADGAVGRVVLLAAVAPVRNERELVVVVGAGRVGDQILLGQDGAAHLHAHTVDGSTALPGRLGGGLGVPALDQQHALAQVAAPGVGVVHGPLARHGRDLRFHFLNALVVPPLHVVSVIAGDGRLAQLLFFLGEVGDGQIEVDRAEAEQVAAVAQVLLCAQAVVQHVSPRLGALVDRLVLGVGGDSDFDPAQTGLEGVVGRVGLLKARTVGVVDVLQQLGLALGVGLGLFAVLARLHVEVLAGAALDADQPVHGGLDLVVDNGVLPAGAHLGGFFVGPLLAVVVVLVHGHLEAVGLLAAYFCLKPTEQAGVLVLRREFGGGLEREFHLTASGMSGHVLLPLRAFADEVSSCRLNSTWSPHTSLLLMGTM